MRKFVDILCIGFIIIGAWIVVVFTDLRDSLAKRIGRFWTYSIIASLAWLLIVFIPLHSLGETIIASCSVILWFFFISRQARWATDNSKEIWLRKVTDEEIRKAIDKWLTEELAKHPSP